MTLKNCIVDGLSIKYEVLGDSKETILMLHGWADSHKTFTPLVGLKDRYCLILVDLPGFGSSETPKEAWGLKEYSKFVADFLTKIGRKDVYAVIGHSNGGAIASYGLANNILFAKKLVLISSSGVRDQEKNKKKLLKVLTKTGKLATAWLPQETKSKLRNKLYENAGSDMLAAPNLQESFKKIVSHDIQEEVKKINQKTLILYGQEDKATPPSYGKVFEQNITNSSLEVLPGAGHFVHQELPNEVYSKISEFMESK